MCHYRRSPTEVITLSNVKNHLSEIRWFYAAAAAAAAAVLDLSSSLCKLSASFYRPCISSTLHSDSLSLSRKARAWRWARNRVDSLLSTCTVFLSDFIEFDRNSTEWV